MAIDTALGACSVAIADQGQIVGHRLKPLARGHAEVLFAMIQEVEEAAGLSAKEMDRFAVTIGPGTFTGLRVGLSAARGLGLAANRPVIGVTTLALVAAGVTSEELDDDNIIAPVFDAKRGECYMQGFDPSLQPLTEPNIFAVTEAAESLDRLSRESGRKALLVGTGAPLFAQHMRQPTKLSLASSQPDAALLARLAADIKDPAEAPAEPLYLRAPDAKLPQSKPLWKPGQDE
jgi:tRNA threonylcarbamoyladenosine biosynthesis protein TsaB